MAFIKRCVVATFLFIPLILVAFIDESRGQDPHYCEQCNENP